MIRNHGTAHADRPSWCCVLAATLALAAGGCGAGDRATAPVSGRITLDAQPLAGGSVNFQPLARAGETSAGRGSFAYCDEEGRYSLETVDGREGAIVATHRVRIYGPRKKQDSSIDGGAPGAEHVEIVPAKYNYETTLTFEVTSGGTTDADFDLATEK